MRLIDADALEVVLHNFFDGKVIDEPAYILRDVFYHIDSAPTVPLPDFKEGYKQAIIDGKTNFSRPEDEWVLEPTRFDGVVIYTCDKCKSLNDLPTHFCPNCGADMRNITETSSSCTTTNPNSVEAYHQTFKEGAKND